MSPCKRQHQTISSFEIILENFIRIMKCISRLSLCITLLNAIWYYYFRCSKRKIFLRLNIKQIASELSDVGEKISLRKARNILEHEFTILMYIWSLRMINLRRMKNFLREYCVSTKEKLIYSNMSGLHRDKGNWRVSK